MLWPIIEFLGIVPVMFSRIALHDKLQAFYFYYRFYYNIFMN